MRTKQFSFLGLVLAMLFGARASRNPQPEHPAPSRATVIAAAKKVAGSPHATKKNQAASDSCGDAVSHAELEEHWWLSPDSKSCARSLSPVWTEVCKINRSRTSDDALLAPTLTGEQFIALCLGKSGPISSMMAAVPNPRRTHLGLMTDRAIEAIQVATSEAHFLPFSHYLPWPAPNEGSASASPESESEKVSDAGQPGILVFQDGDAAFGERPRFLLVFLIPEMPAEGLDRGVFSNAISMIERVSPGMKAIRFAGPNFSGSVGDLMSSELEHGTKKCIHAISGSVTNADKYTSAEKCSSFLPVQTGDHVALCKFVRGARAFGYDSSEIAILSEEGTQYGRQSPGDATQAAGVRKSDATADLWFLHFPREISKLRNAYGAEAGKATPTDATTQTGLGLKWQDAEASRHDDIQTYGDPQTPLSQEAVLSTLSITLKAKGIKALGILATDPMDEAFLIHSIKESAPNIRLFVRDPDLLFLRTPDVGTLNGTLLVSNFPLIPQNQFWSSEEKSAEHHLITFPSAFQEGVYNAFVQLMKEAQWEPAGGTLKELEGGWPAGMDADAEASEGVGSNTETCAETTNPKPGPTPGRPTGKPLWLATIGTAGHYPIKVLNQRDAGDKANLKLHSLDLGPAQFLPIAFWAAVAMLGILHVVGLWFREVVPAYFRSDFDLSHKASTVTLVKLFCHMMALLTIALAQVIIGSSYLFFYGSGWSYATLTGAVIALTALLLGTAGGLLRKLYLLYREQRQAAVPDFRSKIISPNRILRSAIASAAIMVGAGIFWAVRTGGARFDNAFLHFRDLNLSSGVAPTLPLASVLLVLYFGVWAYLRRLSYWEHRYTEMFSLKLDEVIHQDLSSDVKAIDTCLLGPLENRTWMAGFGVVLALSILAFRPWITLDMIEPSSVSRFALFFFVLALLSLWLNWFRFINIWVHLRNILEHLENLPIRMAFQRFPKEKSLPILQWSSSQSNFLLRQVLDRLRALVQAEPTAENIALLAQFEARVDALMTQVAVKFKIVERRVVGGSASSTVRAPARRREDHLRDARKEMNDLTQTLSARLLRDYWKRGSSSGGENPEQKPDPADQKYLLAEDIVALPFYAYIHKIISELRNILFFLGIAVSLLFAALHTYAFRADNAIDWWFFGLFGCMGAGIVIVIAQIERNALVSRLSDRSPGELGSGFYMQLLKYGTVPILTIFGSQVPFVSNVVLKWVQPALEALH